MASKKALHLLVRSLTQLVPYEPPDCLRVGVLAPRIMLLIQFLSGMCAMCSKVHVACPPRGLASCKDLIADYVALAKTRLKDLKVRELALRSDQSL